VPSLPVPSLLEMAEGVTTEEVSMYCSGIAKSFDSKTSLPQALLLVVGEPLNQLYVPALLSRVVTGKEERPTCVE